MLQKPLTHTGRELFRPDYIADSVSEVDFSLLQARGIKAVLIDLDGTTVARGSYDVDKKLIAHLKKQKNIYIATNRPKSRSLKNLKASLNAKGVIHPSGIFAKPMPRYFKKAALKLQLMPAEIAMIGDRYMQDIFGANFTGLTTILVYKHGASKGYIDAFISGIEKRHTDKLAAKYLPARKHK